TQASTCSAYAWGMRSNDARTRDASSASSSPTGLSGSTRLSSMALVSFCFICLLREESAKPLAPPLYAHFERRFANAGHDRHFRILEPLGVLEEQCFTL